MTAENPRTPTTDNDDGPGGGGGAAGDRGDQFRRHALVRLAPFLGPAGAALGGFIVVAMTGFAPKAVLLAVLLTAGMTWISVCGYLQTRKNTTLGRRAGKAAPVGVVLIVAAFVVPFLLACSPTPSPDTDRQSAETTSLGGEITNRSGLGVKVGGIVPGQEAAHGRR